MKNGIISMLLIGCLLLCCGESDKFLIQWSPKNPVQGDAIAIRYNAQHENALIKTASKVNLIAEIIYPDSSATIVMPMQQEGNIFTATIATGEDAIFLGFKLEDDQGHTEDNDSRGWNLLFRDLSGMVVENGYYELGKTWDGASRSGAPPLYAKALESYQKELKAYPENFHVFGSIWKILIRLAEKQEDSSSDPSSLEHSELRALSDLETSFEWAKMAKTPGEIRRRIPAVLDSLLNLYPKNEDALKLAFDLYLMFLNNKPKAIYYGEKFLLEYPSSPDAATVAYYLIFLKYRDSRLEQVQKLESLLKDYPAFKSKEFVYMRLANNYMMLQKPEQAQEAYLKTIEANSEDLTGYLAVANGYIQNGKLEEAKKYVMQAFDQCTIENSQKLYPWINGMDRLQRLKWDEAGINSTLAKVRFEAGDYEGAIQNRVKALELGTQFPAWEWEGIGNAYLKLDNKQQARDAFFEALSINAQQEGALNALIQMYRAEFGSDKGFEDYLDRTLFSHKKKTAKPAPDFEVKKLDGTGFRLSENKGKIVVIYFWATAAEHCLKEIPALNDLVQHFRNNPNVIFLAISIEKKSALDKIAAEANFLYQQCYLGDQAMKTLDVLGFPTHIIVDGNGLERFRQIGYIPGVEQTLGKKINSLLSELTS
ncbi:redoxin domain-containing protein [candidate division KSB1 bacterium]|nr:redoxin domain-containing protein [candidate division KSB1 bacterium]